MIRPVKKGKENLLHKFTLQENVNRLLKCITGEKEKQCRNCKDNDPCSHLTQAVVSIKLTSGC